MRIQKLKEAKEYIVARKATSVVAAFLFGVAVHSFFPLSRISTEVWIALCMVLVAIFFLRGKMGSLSVILFLVMLLGLLRFDLNVPVSEVPGGEREYQGTIEKVTNGIYGQSATVATDEGFKIEARGIIDPVIGEKVGFSCAAKKRTAQDGWSDYRYSGYLHRAEAACTAKEAKKIVEPAWWDLRQMMANYRAAMTRRIMGAVHGDAGALIAGVLYGEQSLSSSAQDIFRNAGLTHIIAVSGSNFTIVVAVVFGLVLGAGLPRRKAFWITTATIVAFALFVGFSSSVVRAAVMGWLVILARYLGRRPRIWHLLFLAAAVICVFDPWALAFDAGFALSFLATIGLVVWTPVLSARLEKIPDTMGIKEAAVTTFAATIMTAPYSALVFEKLTLAGLVTNLLAVPLVPWLMLTGFVTMIWGMWPGYSILSLPSVGFSELIIRISRISEVLPWLDINSQGVSISIILLWYVLMAYFYFNLKKKEAYPHKI